MTKIGDIKQNNKFQKFIWSACVDCGKERWVLVVRGKGRSDRCRSCNARTTRPSIWRDYKKVSASMSGRAWSVVKRLIKNGTIKQMPCEVCGNEQSRAHHPDYNKPLEICWVCQKHHIQIHKNKLS